MPRPPDLSCTETARATVARAFSSLWSSIEAIDDPRDRRAMLDCVRDALDRGAAGPFAQNPELICGTYVVEHRIAEGSTGEILAVRHRDHGWRRVAKRLRADRAHDPLLRRMFLREASHHLAVRDDAVVAAETALRLEDGRSAIVMAHVEGPSLAARLAERPLDAGEATVLARRLLGGLSAIHAAGLVHLDLAPANVLLPEGDPAKGVILDFGLSLPVGASRDDDLDYAATPAFAAPELAGAGRQVDERCDLFALGALLGRALGPGTAEPPDQLGKLIARLTETSPGRRPRTAGEALAVLDAERTPLSNAQPEAVGQQRAAKPPTQLRHEARKTA